MPEPRILIVGAGELGAVLAAALAGVARVVVVADEETREPVLAPVELSDCVLWRSVLVEPELRHVVEVLSAPARRLAPHRRRKRKCRRWYLDTSFIPVRNPVNERRVEPACWLRHQRIESRGPDGRII